MPDQRGEEARVAEFFARVADRFRPPRTGRFGVLTHLLPDRPAFLKALAALGRVEWVIPIPYSESAGVAERVSEAGIEVCRPPRGSAWPPPEAWFGSRLRQTLEVSNEPLVVCEIGGYFAAAVTELATDGPGRLAGVVEDTEAGHRQYAHVAARAVPVFSVARSRLKQPEEILVGESIVFSAERVLRTLDRQLRGTAVTVLGFGNVGAATATAVAARGGRVCVWDPDPARRILALARGYEAPDRDRAIKRADLLIGASGHTSLRLSDLRLLRVGCVLASGSSRRTEFDLALPDTADMPKHPSVAEVALPAGGVAYLAYGGYPINFADGAAIGPFLQLVQGEIIAAVGALLSGESTSGIHEVSQEARDDIARLWLDTFLDLRSGELAPMTAWPSGRRSD